MLFKERSLESYFAAAVADLNGFAIFMLDTNGVIQTWNKGCELMKGYAAEEALGKNFDILFPEFLLDQKLHVKERQLAKEMGRYEVKNWRKKKNGELFWAYVVLTRVHDEEGNHIGFIKITQDQTDEKKYLEQLNIKIEETKNINTKLDIINNELLKSNSNLEEFAYASSHDLQAPIRKINFFVDILKKQLSEKLDDSQQDLFNRIKKSSDRMLGLIEDLLTYSFFNKGSDESCEIDLNEQVKDVLDDLEIDIINKGAKFSVENLPVIRGNKRQLQQLFQNLISNAVKYAKPGTVPIIKLSSVEITGAQAYKNLPIEAADKSFHFIQVKDNGIGFEQEFAEDIFKVFKRLHADNEYSGTGVGLSIVQKVVENHNGYIWAESEPGEGAVFKMLLPVN